MMMMTFGALAAIVVVWVLVGYSLAFGDDLGAGLVGDPLDYLGLQDLVAEDADTWLTVPVILFAVFQGLFCVITGALVSGADRRPGPLRRLDRVRVGVDGPGLRAGGPLGLRPRPGGPRRWLAGEPGRHHRLRRRHGRGDLLRCLRARPGRGRGHPGRLRQGRHAAAQPDPGDARRRPALVRLVRLQRRLRAGREPHGRRGLRDHDAAPAPRVPSAGSPWSGSGTVTPPRSAPRPAWSPGWSRSRPAAAR